jgi:hypothetical protein
VGGNRTDKELAKQTGSGCFVPLADSPKSTIAWAISLKENIIAATKKYIK